MYFLTYSSPHTVYFLMIFQCCCQVVGKIFISSPCKNKYSSFSLLIFWAKPRNTCSHYMCKGNVTVELLIHVCTLLFLKLQVFLFKTYELYFYHLNHLLCNFKTCCPCISLVGGFPSILYAAVYTKTCNF